MPFLSRSSRKVYTGAALAALVAALSPSSSESISRLPIHAFHISCDAVQLSILAKPGSRLSEDEARWDSSEQGSTSLTLVAGPDHLHTSATINTLRVHPS